MKKAITKIVTTIILFALTFTLAGCPYTANGSVIQDVSFTIAYEDADGAQSINATLSLYKTFAPETTKKLIKYFKEDVYENSAIVLTKSQDCAVLGEYNVSNGEYQRINDANFETIKGEFTNNGWKTKNAIKTGALIMLRDADTSTTTSSRYDTAKIKFAVVLSANYEVFSAADYCVFGYMDTESVEALREALQDNAIDEDGNVKLRYAGDRVNDAQTYENGFDYFVNDDGEYYIQGANGLIEVTSKTEDANHALYEKITNDDLIQDIRTLPNTVFTVKNFKLK
ncbi:MAG: peptidylprolyl isomerase [Clostridia bacterium]|nr:peptidylprolyl isomerase [Clostridia bacterium]